MVERLVESYLVSEGRACRVLRLPRATYLYRNCLDSRTELRRRIREIAQARVRKGYRKIPVLLNCEDRNVGKYLVYRLYTEEGLPLKRMKLAGKRKAARQREERLKATGQDQA
jgi:putative transposase